MLWHRSIVSIVSSGHMKALIAPIQLDALLLPNGKVVKDPLADYTRLPYSDKSKDYNSSIPYVGEAILNQPFQDKNLFLKAGVHLHWALPHGLTNTVSFRYIAPSELDQLKSHFSDNFTADWTTYRNTIWNQILLASNWVKTLSAAWGSVLETSDVDQAVFDAGVTALANQVAWTQVQTEVFVADLMLLLDKGLGDEHPTVPDVWLVNRRQNGALQQSWIVESAFISTTTSAALGNLGAVNVPFHDDQADNKTQPYRYMGRRLAATTDWNSSQVTGENYLEAITAVGYNPQAGTKGFGEPSFTAFYPNCMTVYGFYDPAVTAADPTVTYEVLGLYGDGDKDYLRLFLADFANRHAGSETYFDDLNEALSLEFLWKAEEATPIDSAAAVPAYSVLYGKATPQVALDPDPNQVEIAVGNTGTEALSAYLATKLGGDKAQVEDLLESIQVTSKLQNTTLDLGQKFQEARHDAGFIGVAGGNIWNLKLETTDGITAADANDDHTPTPALPDYLADMLNEVNTLQVAYDSEWQVVAGLRRQLFSDWYRYMVSVYPQGDALGFLFDPDELVRYIREDSMQALQAKLDALGTLSVASDDAGRLKAAQAIGGIVGIASELASKLNALIVEAARLSAEIGSDGKSWLDKGKVLALRPEASPRYWEPSDPVVLFAEKPGPNQTPILTNDRHATVGETEPAECKIVDYPLTQANGFSYTAAANFFETVSQLYAATSVTGSSSDAGIWRPFMLEWEVEYLPAFPGSNEATDNRKYDPEYVNQHYTLKETDADLSLAASVNVFQNGNLYTGSTFLTPYAGVSLDTSIQEFLDGYGSNQTAATLQTLTDAQNLLAQTNVLTQSLGGMHEAMRMQKQSRQLDVADPLGFPAYQAFAEEVAPLVGDLNLTSPMPLNDFNPIRSGILKLITLRLVDSFGQTVDFEQPQPIVSAPLTAAGVSDAIHLPPRLVQAARLNFRLLSANSGLLEMNSHPASTPICGWLLPNHLDRSIMFYDQAGAALGALTLNAANPWTAAPDAAATSVTHIESIANTHLQKVVRYLFDRQKESLASLGTADDSFLHHFLNALDSAEENVSPENFAEHRDLAILIGKPLAIIRAKLNLELQESPATDLSWTQLTHELQGHGRTSDAFTQVKFPIRLGEYLQLNDGLIGYWREDSDGSLGDSYYSSEAGVAASEHIQTYDPNGQPLNIYHSLEDPEMNFTLLADPMGSIHVVSGILPVKEISIPKDQYQSALGKIAATFLTAPVLSPEDHLKLSLPKESGFDWKWLQQSAQRQWEEISQTAVIARDLFDSKFRDQPTLWNQLISKGWLNVTQTDPEKATITSTLHRAYPPDITTDPDPFPIDIGKRLDSFFDTYGRRIEPFELNAPPAAQQVIREGWLQLSIAADSEA